MRYVLRRLGFFVVTLWACLTINFVLPRLMPGNPAEAMMSRYKGRINGSALGALEIAFGVNNKQSAISEYFSYLGNTLTGHFGISLTYFPVQVSKIVFGALPWTLGLVGTTTILAFLAGTLVGTVAAWRRGRALDSFLPPLFVIVSAFPYFFLALMGLLLFSVTLGWLPQGFNYTNTDTAGWTWHFIWDVLTHALLPGVVILITSIGGWVLTMRNNMISTLSEDYVRMARAKGLSPLRIMFAYAGRNAMLPNLTGFAMSLGFVVSGAILVEYVFDYPGVGYLLLYAVENEDYALMQTLFLFITVAVLVAVLLMDFATMLLDPRARPRPEGTVSTAALPGGQVSGAKAWWVRFRAGTVAGLFRAIISNRKAAVGLFILVVFCFLAAFPGLVAHDNPQAEIFNPGLGPSGTHLLGTNAYGEDLFAQLIYSTRESLFLAVAAGALATVLSVLVGVTAAYLGGLVDNVLSLFTDVFLVLPAFPLIVVIAAYSKNGGDPVIIAVLVVTGWSYGARQLRVQALSLRNRDFLVAANLRGERRWRVVVSEMLPTMTSLIVAVFLGTTLYAIVAAAGLQFVGLGNPDTLSWGTMLYWAQNNEALQSGSPLWAIMPGVCIALLGAAFALLNYAFDEVGNPALRPVRRKRR